MVRIALRIVQGLGLAAAMVVAGLTFYAVDGYLDALRDASALAERADRLIAEGRGPSGLGLGRFELLLRVEDPAFETHNGVDLSSPGAGITTLTQSLAKRLAFERFRPGLGKLRQTTYALGLERRLTKEQIAALALDTAQMGRGPDGWMQGFYTASGDIYGRAPEALTEAEFLRLVAVLIAPARYDLQRPDPELDDRVGRITRLVHETCEPTGPRDVWLDGCA